jgi:hypothetical protein
MSGQLVALAAAAICAELGIYVLSLTLGRTAPGPIFTLAYGLFAPVLDFHVGLSFAKQPVDKVAQHLAGHIMLGIAVMPDHYMLWGMSGPLTLSTGC